MKEIEKTHIQELAECISSLIENARKQVRTAVNTTMVYTYYEVGRYIVEDEQNGQTHANYGKAVLKELSANLTEKFGAGWSVETLTKCRRFYNVYSISQTACTKSEKSALRANNLNPKNIIPKMNFVHSVDEIHNFILPWSHYQVLMREENPQARSFYEKEAYNQQWSVRQLQRQVASSLYERLALSRDKEEVMRLANEGQTIEKPTDIIKNPLVLEFIGLKPDSALQTKVREWISEYKDINEEEEEG